MTDLLLQHGSGPFAEMLKISSAQHDCYAKTFALDYLTTLEPVECEDRYKAWEKIAGLRHQLKVRPIGTKIMLLDADALIKQFVDFRGNVSEEKPIAVFGSKGWCNSGTLMVYNCELVQTVFKAVWDACDDEVSGVDRMLYQTLRKLGVNFSFLNEAWNYFPFYGDAPRRTTITEDQAIVKAWHGFTEKKAIRKMKQELELLVKV